MALLADFLSEQAHLLHTQLGQVAGVALTMRTDVGPVTIGASSELAHDVDLTQYEVGTGPCLAALETGQSFYVPDLAVDERWGVYGRLAAERGARCCVSVPVLVDGEPAAVAKAYAEEVDGLSPGQQRQVAARAVELSGAVGLARALTEQAQQLDDRIAAMDHRHTIDLAVGVVMGRTGSTADEAFALLRAQSNRANTKLYDVAKQLIGSGATELGAAPFRQRGAVPLP